MAKTLLQGVNEVLKRVQVIHGTSGDLTSLDNSGRQTFIDTAVQAWNEMVEQIFSDSSMALPKELEEATITLLTGDRDYALATNLVQLRWPFINETNGHFIAEHPGGYLNLVSQQLIPANYTGQPQLAAIRPTDGQLYLDRIPTSVENGDVYKYRFDKDVSLSIATSEFPFSDAVFRAMVPAVAEVWKRHQRNSFDNEMFRMSMGRAGRLLTQQQQRESYIHFGVTASSTDPYAS